MRTARFIDKRTEAQPGDEFLVLKDAWHTAPVIGHKNAAYLGGPNSGVCDPMNIGSWGLKEFYRMAQAVDDKIGYGSPTMRDPTYREVRWYMRRGRAWTRSLHQFVADTIDLPAIFCDNCNTKAVSTGMAVMTDNDSDATIATEMWDSCEEIILTRLQWGRPVYFVCNLPKWFWAMDSMGRYPTGPVAARLNARKAHSIGASAICLEDPDKRPKGQVAGDSVDEIVAECVRLGLDVWMKCTTNTARRDELFALAGERGVDMIVPVKT